MDYNYFFHSVSIVLLILLFPLTMVYGQNETVSGPGNNETAETDTSHWEHNFRTSLTGSQASFRNWSQGGTDNFSVLGTAAYLSAYKKKHFGLRTSINLRYGQSRIGDGDFIKTDDIIRMRNQARWIFRDERYSAIFNVNFESQFDKGYDNPVPSEGESREMISRFFTPAYISQTLGLSYNPDRHLRFESGLAMKQTIVSDTTLAAHYGLDPGESFRNEAGFSALVGYDRRIMENIYYSGFVETFWNVNKSLTSSDVFFVSEITGRINRFISANVELALAYNDDITEELQVKQIISVGFSYTFLGD